MKTVKSIERKKWDKIEDFFIKNFTDGERPDMDTILFLIGVQELGQGKKKFSKDDKVNLIHIAVCTILEPFGYYRFEGRDADDWPQFEFMEPLPELKANEQSLLMKYAIIQYFEDKNLI
ncbi:MAG: hypothetical protein PHO74_08335 [Weeksellaceae bacterium]|jgi:hypothetical protein|nr:hypothetical protein [Weeksellaceae bacterium]